MGVELGRGARHARLDYALSRRLIAAASRQTVYRAAYGAFWWWLARRLPLVVYAWLRLHGSSRITAIVVEQGETGLAAVTLMPWGEFAGLVVVGTPAERLAALRRLWQEIDRMLAVDDRPFFVLTDPDFRSMIAALERRGVAPVPATETQMTLPFGPLTWTWVTRRPRRWPAVRRVRLVRLERSPTKPTASPEIPRSPKGDEHPVPAGR